MKLPNDLKHRNKCFSTLAPNKWQGCPFDFPLQKGVHSEKHLRNIQIKHFDFGSLPVGMKQIWFGFPGNTQLFCLHTGREGLSLRLARRRGSRFNSPMFSYLNKARGLGVGNSKCPHLPFALLRTICILPNKSLRDSIFHTLSLLDIFSSGDSTANFMDVTNHRLRHKEIFNT